MRNRTDNTLASMIKQVTTRLAVDRATPFSAHGSSSEAQTLPGVDATAGLELWEITKLNSARDQGRLPSRQRTLLVSRCHGCGRDIGLTFAEAIRHSCTTRPREFPNRCAHCDRTDNTRHFDGLPRPSTDIVDPWDVGVEAESPIRHGGNGA